jgi:hypothetical protein
MNNSGCAQCDCSLYRDDINNGPLAQCPACPHQASRHTNAPLAPQGSRSPKSPKYRAGVPDFKQSNSQFLLKLQNNILVKLAGFSYEHRAASHATLVRYGNLPPTNPTGGEWSPASLWAHHGKLPNTKLTPVNFISDYVLKNNIIPCWTGDPELAKKPQRRRAQKRKRTIPVTPRKKIKVNEGFTWRVFGKAVAETVSRDVIQANLPGMNSQQISKRVSGAKGAGYMTSPHRGSSVKLTAMGAKLIDELRMNPPSTCKVLLCARLCAKCLTVCVQECGSV